MFGNLGLHVIKNPAGTYSYVGSLPAALASIIPASDADVMGGRAFRDDSGAIMTHKFPVFKTAAAAVAFAASHGFTAVDDSRGC